MRGVLVGVIGRWVVKVGSRPTDLGGRAAILGSRLAVHPTASESPRLGLPLAWRLAVFRCVFLAFTDGKCVSLVALGSTSRGLLTWLSWVVERLTLVVGQPVLMVGRLTRVAGRLPLLRCMDR